MELEKSKIEINDIPCVVNCGKSFMRPYIIIVYTRIVFNVVK